MNLQDNCAIVIFYFACAIHSHTVLVVFFFTCIIFSFLTLSFLISFFCSLRCSRTNYYIPFFPNHAKERETKNNKKKHTYTDITHTYTQKDRKKSTTMNNIVLICLTTNEQDSYGLARRLALITGRRLGSSPPTLKGLQNNKEIVINLFIHSMILTYFQVLEKE